MPDRTPELGLNHEGEHNLTTSPTEYGSERLGVKLLLAGVAFGSVILGVVDGMAIAQIADGQGFKSVEDVLGTSTRIQWPFVLAALNMCAGKAVTDLAENRLLRS